MFKITVWLPVITDSNGYFCYLVPHLCHGNKNIIILKKTLDSFEVIHPFNIQI